jgi:DNA-binding NarL/FixJ family response regulator
LHKFVTKQLTKQEVEIAKSLSKNNWTPNRVAVVLGLHTSTVNIRLNRIYRKLETYFGLKEADLSTLTIILKGYWEMNPDQ